MIDSCFSLPSASFVASVEVVYVPGCIEYAHPLEVGGLGNGVVENEHGERGADCEEEYPEENGRCL